MNSLINRLLESVAQELYDLKVRVDSLISQVQALEFPWPSSSSPNPTYAEVTRRASTVTPPSSSLPPSPFVRARSPCHMAAKRLGLVVLYLLIPVDISDPKPSTIRERFHKHKLPNTFNVSLIGNEYVEVLLKVEDFLEWRQHASMHFELIGNLNLLSTREMQKAYPAASSTRALRRILNIRLKREIDQADRFGRKKVKSFYQEWYNSLSPLKPLSNPHLST